jgi:hypothetical protein
MYMFCGVAGFDYDIEKKGITPLKLEWKGGCLKLLANPEKLKERLKNFSEVIQEGRTHA